MLVIRLRLGWGEHARTSPTNFGPCKLGSIVSRCACAHNSNTPHTAGGLHTPPVHQTLSRTHATPGGGAGITATTAQPHALGGSHEMLTVPCISEWPAGKTRGHRVLRRTLGALVLARPPLHTRPCLITLSLAVHACTRGNQLLSDTIATNNMRAHVHAAPCRGAPPHVRPRPTYAK